MNRNTITRNFNKMKFYLNLLLLTFVAAGYTSAADITTQCSEYTDGERANASVTINTTTVNGSPCAAGDLSEIYFRFKFISNNSITEYRRAAYNPGGQCDGTWQTNVSCVGYNPSKHTITYMLQFVANKTLHGQQYLTVETNCIPVGSNTPFSVDYSSCNPIPFPVGTTIKNGEQTTSSISVSSESSNTYTLPSRTSYVTDNITESSSPSASSLIDIPALEVLVIWSMTKVIWLLSS